MSHKKETIPWTKLESLEQENVKSPSLRVSFNQRPDRHPSILEAVCRSVGGKVGIIGERSISHSRRSSGEEMDKSSSARPWSSVVVGGIGFSAGAWMFGGDQVI
jgi:hypothetical protein